MALKVRCPKCRAEVVNPPDLRAVACPCGAMFDGRSAPPGYWIGAGVLCALVLVALWITAWQNRARKLSERYGERISATAPGPGGRPLLNLSLERRDAAIDEYFERFARDYPAEPADVEFPADAPSGLQERTMETAARHGVRVRFFSGESGRMTLRLRAGHGLLVHHFELDRRLSGADLGVRDAKGVPLVEFRGLGPGDVRRWHELEIRCVERSDAALVLDLELKPGSPCFGTGVYSLRAGLRVDLPKARSVLVVRFDPSPAAAHVVVREGERSWPAAVTPNSVNPAPAPVRLRLQPLEDGGTGLAIDEP